MASNKWVNRSVKSSQVLSSAQLHTIHTNQTSGTVQSQLATLATLTFGLNANIEQLPQLINTDNNYFRSSSVKGLNPLNPIVHFWLHHTAHWFCVSVGQGEVGGSPVGCCAHGGCQAWL